MLPRLSLGAGSNGRTGSRRLGEFELLDGLFTMVAAGRMKHVSVFCRGAAPPLAVAATSACSPRRPAAGLPRSPLAPSAPAPASAGPSLADTPSSIASAAERNQIVAPLESVELGGTVKTAVLAGPVVYAVGYPVHGASILRRVSVPTGAVTASITLPGCVGGASVSNGALAVLSESDANCATATSLRLLDPITLRTIWERPVPASGDVLARTNGIYVSQKGHISIYDDNTLAFARSVAIDSSPPLYAGVYLAADPDSDVLWAGIASDRYPVMDAVSLITYRVLSRTPLEAVTAGLPQGMGDDTWVIYATGMMSAVELITSTGHVVARLGGIGANYAVEQVTGRHVWTGFALDDALSLSCRSLISGGVQGRTLLATPGQTPRLIGADNGYVYVSVANELRVYRPVGTCR